MTGLNPRNIDFLCLKIEALAHLGTRGGQLSCGDRRHTAAQIPNSETPVVNFDRSRQGDLFHCPGPLIPAPT